MTSPRNISDPMYNWNMGWKIKLWPIWITTRSKSMRLKERFLRLELFILIVSFKVFGLFLFCFQCVSFLQILIPKLSNFKRVFDPIFSFWKFVFFNWKILTLSSMHQGFNTFSHCNLLLLLYSHGLNYLLQQIKAFITLLQ